MGVLLNQKISDDLEVNLDLNNSIRNQFNVVMSSATLGRLAFRMNFEAKDKIDTITGGFLSGGDKIGMMASARYSRSNECLVPYKFHLLLNNYKPFILALDRSNLKFG